MQDWIISASARREEGPKQENILSLYQSDNGPNFGQVKDHIQVEIDAFTQPAPYERKLFNLISVSFWQQKGFGEITRQFRLESFEVNVLTRERTVFEKLLSLVRLSYDGTDKVRGKIRHFYDIHQLLNQTNLKNKILIEENFKIFKWVMQDDAANGIFPEIG